MRLSELQTGQQGKVVKILGHGAFRKRVMEMGFVKGHNVKVLLHAPMRDPIKYSIMGYEVSLRRSEAALIEVEPINDDSQGDAYLKTFDPAAPDHGTSASHTINLALIGNPNCGKTSLFNIASGAREHVGNYSGVTVDAKSGYIDYKGYRFNIVDLPGTYSLTSYSPEELYVRRYLKEQTPDVIVNVVDSSNLERNLYLTTELIDMDRSMVIALNMFDELRNRGVKLDYEMLGGMIGVPMVPIVSKTGEGVDALFDAVIDVYEHSHAAVRHVHVNLGADIEKDIRTLVDAIKEHSGADLHFSPRYIAIKLLEGDTEAETMLGDGQETEAILTIRDNLLHRYEAAHDEDVSSTVAAEKYGFIAGALAETYVAGKEEKYTFTRFVDKLVTSKVLGFPLFFAIMFVIFWATFALGQYPMYWIENGVAWLSDILGRTLPDGIVKDMLVDGALGGVGGVIVFLPNILILYFCISFMEDSGYMARAAFIMDHVMHKIGLHGKSFIPLVMGFGCNVPAIMASRTIESKSSRIITILINPFMSCSARLPIYVLLIGTFFPEHPTLVFMSLYLGGIVIAMITARLLRRFYFKKDETPFVMELPPYRLPTLKASLRHTWAKGEQYLKKMGGIILVASLVVWALNYFPINPHRSELAPTELTAQADETTIAPGDSYLQMAGKVINPVLAPLGFHWRASVAALAGVPAKEIVVSTLGVLYTDDEAVTPQKLGARLQSPSPATGRPDWGAPEALSFMVFILLYCPCIATLTAIVRETGSWRYAIFSVVYNTLVAWLAAFTVYRVALLG